MLSHLSIRNIVLIEALDIAFAPGMTILTGETGAGKSILLDALSLALGARGDAALVRAGAESGLVTAAFDMPHGHPALALLAADLPAGERELILRRVQYADGRTHAFLNDQRISATRLREVGALLVEIHGQHESRALIDAAAHRELLDAYGALEESGEALAHLWRSWKALEARRARLAEKIAEVEREGDYLRASLEELEKLAPQPGEEETLATRRQEMMVAEKITADLADMLETLNGSSSPLPVLASLFRRLERKRDTMPALANIADELGKALDASENARGELETLFSESSFSPKELEDTEERLFDLRAAARKFRVPCDELPRVRARVTEQLQALESGTEELHGIETAIEAARKAYFEAAHALSKARGQAAEALAQAVMTELPALKLEKVKFFVHLQTDEAHAGPGGLDQVVFHVQTNPGADPGPLAKIASGGEQSRILLALKVALADRGSAPTLIFDEIDTGVGGAVAEAMGLRLARLAEGVQVLSVTHAPQVAACAAHHLLITKTSKATNEVITHVEGLSEANRLEEIARMLAGATITDEARSAARRLLERG